MLIYLIYLSVIILSAAENQFFWSDLQSIYDDVPLKITE